MSDSPQTAPQVEPDITLERARLGIETQVFLRSNVGRYLMECADLMREIANQNLIATDPYDVPACVKERNDILVADLFKKWLRDAIASGELAEDEIREQDALGGEFNFPDGYPV